MNPQAMQQLRAISGEFVRQDVGGGTARAIAFATVRPATALWRSWQAVRQYGQAVSATSGIAVAKQLLQLWKLRMFHGYTAEEYYRYRLYRAPTDKATLFVVQAEYMAVRPRLYRQLSLGPAMLADKRQFYRECEKAGLPVPQTIADFEKDDVRWWKDNGLPACDLFAKEACSIAGAGAACWKYDGAVRRWTGADGNTYDHEHLIRHLADLSWKAPLLVQRRLTNHPELRDLGPSGVCTVRIVTMRSVDNPSPTVLAATFRMPAAGWITDNFSVGGLASPVDLASGCLGPAVVRDLSRAYIDVHEHPVSGGRIDGRILPMWQAAVSIVIAAHTNFSQFPSVGWDIAITPEGPVLMEGNYDWGVSLVQQPGARPLGTTAYPEHLLRWLAASDARKAGNTPV